MFITRPPAMDRRWKGSEGSEMAPSCPRCASPNTKFCYYNNYSLSQPRYLCKSCRRYWTKGGSLRNVPVGGGCRKSRRARSDPALPCRIPPDPLWPDPGSGSAEPPPGSEGGGASNGETPEIDLAQVFSNFLNHDPGYDPEASGPDNPHTSRAESGSSSCAPSSLEPIFPRDGLLEEHPGVFLGEEEMGFDDGRFIGHDPSTFGFPGLLGDEAAAVDGDHGGLWSTPDGPNHSDGGKFAWNPAWEEEYDLFPSDDDQLRISTDLMCDNWSAFDLSGI